jgi:hypothetical protein
MAKTELEAAQALIPQLTSQAATFDVDAALDTFDQIADSTSSAASLTDDPIWRVAEFFPVLGKNFAAVRQLAAATSGVITEVAGPLLGVVETLNPSSLVPRGGAIDLAPFEDAVPVISSASQASVVLLAEIASIDTDGTFDQIAGAKATVGDALESISSALDMADRVVPIVPVALGSEGPRTYVVMFQNNAEPRALGGTALSFAVITVDAGKIELTATIPAGFENFPVFDPPIVSTEAGVQNFYSDAVLGGFIPNVTTRPSFVGAAEITQETWRRTFGYEVDAIVSVDPVFLSYVLRATDPIALTTGDVLQSDTIVPLLLNGVYQRFNTSDPVADNAAQDVVYSEAVSATFAALTSGALKPPELLAAIAQGWSEERLLMWSAHEDEQRVLAEIGLPGELPISDEVTDRFGVYFQDNVGSKLGYYLRQTVRLESANCRDDGRVVYRVSVDVAHTLDPAEVDGLSASIAGNWLAEGVPRAWQRLIVMIYAPPGAELISANIDGQIVPTSARFDSDRPVELNTIEIAPGTTRTLTFDYVASQVGAKKLEAKITPLVNPTELIVGPLDCTTVAG